MATNSSDMGESQPSTSGASGGPNDWDVAFQSPEFLSGLQTALGGVANSTPPRPDHLEQLGDSIPSQPTTSSASAPLVQRIPSAWARFHLCWSRESSPVHSLNYRSFSPRILDPPAKECQTWTFYLGLNASIYIYWL